MARKPAARIPEGYDPAAYPKVAVTVDVVVLTVLDRRLHVLLVERGAEPWLGAWALPGGFIHPDESLDEAAARELREETGVDASAHLEQVGAYGDPDRDPRMRVVTVAYLAVLPRVGALAAGTDAARAELCPVDEILGPKARRSLAFDHKRILSDAVDRARERLSSTSLAAAFAGPEFTLGDLREVYEAAWGLELDPGNFRRKVLSTQNFVAPTGRFAESGPEGGKRAEIYRSRGPARLHPPLQPPFEDDLGFTGALLRPLSASSALGRDRTTVWRCWLGDDPAFQRTLIEKGVLTPVARGKEPISDEEWNAFVAGMQVGDYVVARLARGKVAIGEIASGIRERRRSGDRRLQTVRDVLWHAELPRAELPDDLRVPLEAPGVVTPIRVTAAVRRVRELLAR